MTKPKELLKISPKIFVSFLEFNWKFQRKNSKLPCPSNKCVYMQQLNTITIQAKDFERCYASKSAGIDSVCGRLSADFTFAFRAYWFHRIGPIISLIVHLFVRLCARSFVRQFVRSFIRLLVLWFVCPSVHPSVCQLTVFISFSKFFA